MTRVHRVDRLMHRNRLRNARAKPRTKLVGTDGAPLRARREHRRRDGWTVRLARLALVTSIVVFGLGLWNQRVLEVDVTGVAIADRDAVEAVAAELEGRRWIDPGAEDVRADAEALAWVRVVDVVRRLPAGITLRVEESSPVAWTDVDGARWGVDAEGRVAPLPSSVIVHGMPRVEGLVGANGVVRDAARQRLGRLLSAVREGGWPFDAGLASIALGPRDGIALRTNDAIEVWLGPQGTAEQLRVAAVAWDHLDPSPGDRLDLRFERQAVLTRAADRPAADRSRDDPPAGG
ncbi:MAG TPA: FtsQ-type POTRA domain-containing protein [Candidatus Krumholzibacteria bacterium]|nr:FtsQ-type POTRA domain-containing protein [Candidatus Krumholzibacteria bacterium]